MLVSAVQHRDSVLRICIFFRFLTHLGYYKILSIVLPCAVQSVGPCCSSILYIVVCICSMIFKNLFYKKKVNVVGFFLMLFFNL